MARRGHVPISRHARGLRPGGGRGYAALVLTAFAGALAGAAAAALPGVQVNALALAVLALAPASGERGGAFLVGAMAGAPFGHALGATLAGDSELPAHRLAREGRATEAIARLCWGAFAGLAIALPVGLALRPILEAEAPRIADAMPWILLAVVALLVATEPARPVVHRHRIAVPDPYGLHAGATETVWTQGPLSWPAGMALALLVLSISGALGLVALWAGARSPLGLPASPLLPLLAGLFAAPALVAALRGAPQRRPRARLRAPRLPRGEWLRASWPGALASAFLGAIPGVSASHAQALTPRARTPERTLLAQGAVHGGAVVFGLVALAALGKARHGALLALVRIAPAGDLLDQLAWVLAGAALACLAVRLISHRLARWPARPLAWGGLALVLGASVATCGAWGLALLATAALVGAVPARLGVRRSLCMGAILVPALLRAWGAG